MTTKPQNIKHALATLRTDISKEIKRLKKTLDQDDPANAVFIANLGAVQHQLDALGAFWKNVCLKSYAKSGAKSPLIQGSDRTLHVALRDSNEIVAGDDQNEVFFNAIKAIGLKACHEACMAKNIFAIKARRELLVDLTPQSRSYKQGKENGVDYYVYTNLSCSKKIEFLKLVGKATGCQILAEQQ